MGFENNPVVILGDRIKSVSVCHFQSALKLLMFLTNVQLNEMCGPKYQSLNTQIQNLKKGKKSERIFFILFNIN